MLKEVSRDLSTLMRQEVELAKAELRESASKAGKGAGMFTGAALAGYMVLLFLSLALWAGISNLTGPVWAAIIVAIIWAIVAAILALKGKKELKAVEGVPQTTETVKEIPEALK
ncbi:phage holin family protein [Brevibacterium sp.]|uniref:phage holin family protein n=1 Tax=Brevibacterium sp. TaxID=1701 RepID=UPI0028120CA4|nr:phage holin family protein [Brevibacterium sp.]